MVTLTIDRAIYDDACCSKVVYSMADRYVIERRLTAPDVEEWTIHTDAADGKDKIVSDVYERLNDYKLRCIIEQETHDIKTVLYAKAFSECDDISESDLEE